MSIHLSRLLFYIWFSNMHNKIGRVAPVSVCLFSQLFSPVSLFSSPRLYSKHDNRHTHHTNVHTHTHRVGSLSLSLSSNEGCVLSLLKKILAQVVQVVCGLFLLPIGEPRSSFKALCFPLPSEPGHRVQTYLSDTKSSTPPAFARLLLYFCDVRAAGLCRWRG